MLRTRFTDLVGCSLPLQLAAMPGVGTPELVAAVADAGGLGDDRAATGARALWSPRRSTSSPAAPAAPSA